jgi:thioredoxin reductase (NADPH)
MTETTMARIAIIGDGPAGLSAALFLAKNGQQVQVYGKDETAMHYAMLHNYLGVDDVTGSDFQAKARQQVEGHGAELIDDEVTELSADGDTFRLTTADGRSESADYLVLAAARPGAKLATQLGIEAPKEGIPTDGEQRTSVDRVYAAGRIARQHRSQAIISAGAGAVAALDILSREAGEEVHDWDSPPSED